MPNPRNRLKLTGDTHLPDVGDEGGSDEDVLRFEPASAEDREEAAAPDLIAATESAVDASRGVLQLVRDEVRARPVRALGAAFALGFVLACF